MSWKVSLDKYLTTPPDDGFDSWCDDVIGNKISEEFYFKNEDWIFNNNGLCDKWLNRLFDKGKSSEEAANILQRTFNLYKINK